MRIGIVGGGVAGLAAGYRLSLAGHQVTVFEAASELGGQAGTFLVAGARLERFYHHFFRSDRVALGLVEELGLGDRLVWAPDRSAYFHDGRVYPFVSPTDLLRFKPLSWPSRLVFGLQTAYLLFGANWRNLEQVTARDWLLKWGTRSVYDVIWGALLRAKFGDYANRVSMAWLWGKLNARRGKSVGARRQALAYLKGSFQILVDALAERIVASGGAVCTSARVQQVLVSEGAARGLRVERDGQTQEHAFDRIILTTPSPTVLELAPDLPAPYREQLASLPYEGAMVLVLALDRSLAPSYWLSLADPEIPMVVAVEHTHFVPPEEYGGRHIIYFGRYLPADHPDFGLDAQALLTAYEPYIRRLNPRFDRSWVVNAWLFKDPYGQPVIEPGYSQRIPAHRTPIENLYLANTTQIYPEDRGVNYSVLLGEVIAQIVQGGEARASLLW
jgi:protoporphyrinogen oxidase